MQKIGILTSGGDAPGMNPCIRSVVRTAIYNDLEVIGIKRGYCGLVEKDFEKMDRGSVADIIHRGGTILLTARCKLFMEKKFRLKAYKHMKEEGIEGLIVIGGNGSLRGAQIIGEEFNIPVVGIPGTIDNDLSCTDITIGFDTAMNTVLDAINKIRDTATSHERTFIIETMGRNAGFLTLMTGLAGGAESILIPEIEYSIDEICEKIKQGYKRGKLHSIILVAEGIDGDFKTNRDICKSKATFIGEEINKRTGLETRIIILGHLQRGGHPTAQDRVLASRMGAKAVDLLLDDIGNKMISFKNNKIDVFEIDRVLEEEKKIDRDIFDLAHILSL